MLKSGCAASEIKVPLFLELYGYGPFLGRRNQGTHDPLFCRAVSFHDGENRLIMISNDLCVTDGEAAWTIRTAIARKLKMNTDGIMISGSHTHSAPPISWGIAWGELSHSFQQYWIELAVSTALEAVKDESPVSAFAGRAELTQPLGENRVFKDGPVDPDIRWIKFIREDGSVKLLLHNHGMHGVVYGQNMNLVSADWMGAASQLILDRKLADNTLFLYGAAGNINTSPCCLGLEQGDKEQRRIAESYVTDLEKSLAGQARQLSLLPLKARLVRQQLPTVPVTPDQLRSDASKLRAMENCNKFLCDRMDEMALYIEAGNNINVITDLQVLRIGDIFIYAFPGEPFVELGRKIMAKSPGKFAIAVGVANDNCRYFPTPETFDCFPDGLYSNNRSYGYYEIYQGCGRFMPVFKRNIASFITDRLLEIAASIAD